MFDSNRFPKASGAPSSSPFPSSSSFFFSSSLCSSSASFPLWSRRQAVFVNQVNGP